MSRKQKQQERLGELKESKKCLKIQEKTRKRDGKNQKEKRDIEYKKKEKEFKQNLIERLKKKFERQMQKKLKAKIQSKMYSYKHDVINSRAKEEVEIIKQRRLNKQLECCRDEYNLFAGISVATKCELIMRSDKIIKLHNEKYKNKNMLGKLHGKREKLRSELEQNRIQKKKRIIYEKTLYFCYFAGNILPNEVIEIIVSDFQSKYRQLYKC